jgi:hypothetical protein
MADYQPDVVSYNTHMHDLDLPVGGIIWHRDAHGLGRPPNAWSRRGEKNEGEETGESSGKVVVGGVMLGVAVVAVAVMVWARVKKGGS